MMNTELIHIHHTHLWYRTRQIQHNTQKKTKHCTNVWLWLDQTILTSRYKKKGNFFTLNKNCMWPLHRHTWCSSFHGLLLPFFELVYSGLEQNKRTRSQKWGSECGGSDTFNQYWLTLPSPWDWYAEPTRQLTVSSCIPHEWMIILLHVWKLRFTPCSPCSV